MQCPQCQHDNSAGQKFCGECGARLAATCSACGASNLPGQKFCGECGTPLAKAAERRFTSPQTYTPQHLAEKILTSKSAIEGERKQVTVLFADLKGSTELLADRDPEDARKLLDPVLEHMMEAVHRYEGTVNQVMGDGIMALFGAPVAHEDHAVRACYAALRMQDSVKRYADGVRREYGVTVRIRVGLNSGQVVVRAIGSDLHMDYTAVGQTTHLAARMEQLADPGSILLAPDTLALAEGFVQVTSLGPMAVKGLPVPVEVHELTGVSTVRSRLQAATIRGLSRFVGRDSEIEQLRRALEQARLARGQVAAIVGEAGVGKSRLVFELTHSHRVEGWLVLEAGSVSYGKATSYLPVIDLLKSYFGIGDGDKYRGIREKVTGKILTLDRALEPTIAALLALLDVPIEDPHWSALDPPVRRQRTLDALKRLLLREAQVQPLLVVFEDLHWIDSETQALLDSLIEILPTARVLLLVNYRPEYRHGWGSKTYYTQLRLDTLPPESTEALLDALLGRDPSLHRLKSLLADRTAGNPLFLEESVRTLVETKALVGERGAYRLVQAVETVEVPATVQVILSSRIDRSPPEEKRLLETAAVIGKDFPFSLLQAIADEPEETLRQRLEHLKAAEFVYETSLFPDIEYTFKHALTHEVAYGSLLQERRRTLHARIVDAIETLYPGRLTEQVERLGYHAARGELWAKAASYLRQAGTRAAFRSAHLEAIEFFEHGLVALERLPETPERLEQAIDYRLELRTALFPLARQQRLLTLHKEIELLAERLGDPRRRGLATAYFAHYCWSVGDQRLGLQYGERALALAIAESDLDLHIEATHRLGMVYHALGQYDHATTVLRDCLAQLESRGNPSTFYLTPLRRVVVRTWLAWSLSELGAFPEATRLAEEAVQIGEDANHLFSRFHAYWGLGVVRLRKGDHAGAIVALEQSRALSEVGHLPFMNAFAVSYLAQAFSQASRLVEAHTLLTRVAAETAANKMMFCHSLATAHQAEAHLFAGQVDRALEFANKALELSRGQGDQGQEGWALYLLGEAASSCTPQDFGFAESYYGQALALATNRRMRPLLAHCYFGLGKLNLRVGKRQAAREHLDTATGMYREMGMQSWLEKGEETLRAIVK